MRNNAVHLFKYYSRQHGTHALEYIARHQNINTFFQMSLWVLCLFKKLLTNEKFLGIQFENITCLPTFFMASCSGVIFSSSSRALL